MSPAEIRGSAVAPTGVSGRVNSPVEEGVGGGHDHNGTMKRSDVLRETEERRDILSKTGKQGEVLSGTRKLEL